MWTPSWRKTVRSGFPPWLPCLCSAWCCESLRGWLRAKLKRLRGASRDEIVAAASCCAESAEAFAPWRWAWGHLGSPESLRNNGRRVGAWLNGSQSSTLNSFPAHPFPGETALPFRGGGNCRQNWRLVKWVVSQACSGHFMGFISPNFVTTKPVV